MADERLGADTEFEVLRIEGAGAAAVRQTVATEVRCAIVLNGREAASAMATPAFLEELAIGHLFTAGLIGSASEVRSCRVVEGDLRVEVETARVGPGRPRAALGEGPKVRAEALVACMQWLLSASATFFATHGVHSAALSPEGAPPDLFIDDIGRHNAVDKIIGHGLLGGVDFARCVLLTTGRMPSEILFKATRAGIPIVVSRGAPTSHTIRTARDAGLTIASSGRTGGLTVYSGHGRVLVG